MKRSRPSGGVSVGPLTLENSMRFRLNRSILAAALAFAAAPAFAQDTFSQTIFFGDSLTDAGFYQTVLVAQFGAQAGTAARFTTNPGLVWAEFLADY
jgi:outer membrane lipase/esterase